MNIFRLSILVSWNWVIGSRLDYHPPHLPFLPNLEEYNAVKIIEYNREYFKSTINNCSLTLQYAGYFDIEPEKNLFYLLIEGEDKTSPLILWMNGGPGTSSLVGMYSGIGPCNTDNQSNLYAWTKFSSVLFLDQPVGTGFSYGNASINDVETASNDVFKALIQFYYKFPRYQNRPFHIVTESFGGQIATRIALRILLANQNKFYPLYRYKSAQYEIKLTSLIMGSPLLDIGIQAESYPELACKNPFGATLIKENCDIMKNSLNKYRRISARCREHPPPSIECQKAWNYVDDKLLNPYYSTGMNPFDLRVAAENDRLRFKNDENSIKVTLNDILLQQKLGIKTTVFECNNIEVNNAFTSNSQLMHSTVPILKQLLDKNLPILIYSGEADFLCNWRGLQDTLNSIVWKGQSGFIESKFTELNYYKTNSWFKPRHLASSFSSIGLLREFNNLSFLRIFGAGHMVYYDQPRAIYNLLSSWVFNTSLKFVNN